MMIATRVEKKSSRWIVFFVYVQYIIHIGPRAPLHHHGRLSSAATSSGNSAIKHVYIITTCYRYLHVGGRANFGCGDRAANDLYIIILVSYYNV